MDNEWKVYTVEITCPECTLDHILNKINELKYAKVISCEEVDE